MNKAKTGVLSGCVVMLILFGVFSSCLPPLGLFVGSMTSGLSSGFVARTMGRSMCPAGSEATVYSYATTMRDSDGFLIPSTAYEVRCVNSDGEMVKDLGPTPFFIWIGALGVVGLAAALVLALALAAPAGVLIARLRRPGTTGPL